MGFFGAMGGALRSAATAPHRLGMQANRAIGMPAPSLGMGGQQRPPQAGGAMGQMMRRQGIGPSPQMPPPQQQMPPPEMMPQQQMMPPPQGRMGNTGIAGNMDPNRIQQMMMRNRQQQGGMY